MSHGPPGVRRRWLPSLILVTLALGGVLVVLQLWGERGQASLSHQNEQAVLKELAERGATLSHGYPEALRVVLGNRDRDRANIDVELALLARLPHVEHLTMSGHRRQTARLSQKGMDQLGQISRLRSLFITPSTSLKDLDLTPLANLTELESLTIPAGDERLAAIKGLPQLRSLKLTGPVSENGLKEVGQCAALESLDLTSCNVTDAGVAHLQRLLLRSLTLDNNDIGDEAMASIGEIYTLRVLTLRNTKVGDAGLQHLRRLPTLRAVSLKGTRVTNQGLAIFDELPPLQDMELP